MKTEPTLKIGNQTHKLTFDNAARFRFGQLGGSLIAILTAGQDYYQICIAIWSALPDSVRAEVEPCDLAVVVDPEAAEEHQAIFQSMVEHWYPDCLTSGAMEPDALALIRPHLPGNR